MEKKNEIYLCNFTLFDDKEIDTLFEKKKFVNLKGYPWPYTAGVSFDGEKFVSYVVNASGNVHVTKSSLNFYEVLDQSRKDFHEVYQAKCTNTEDENMKAHFYSLCNSELLNEAVINYHRMFKTKLNYRKIYNSVGLAFDNGKYISYTTDNNAEVSNKKEFDNFDGALLDALNIYKQMRSESNKRKTSKNKK